MSIRHLATSLSGSIVAAGEFEHRVHLWDLATARHVATFDSVLDFGGRRLAITADGKCCVAAAYHVKGVAAYSASDGAENWRRKDLKKAQHVRVSLDDRRVYCSFDDKPCEVLNRETGTTVNKWSGVRDVWESPYEPLMLLEKRELVLQTADEEKITTIARETFAVLYVAFAPGLVCVSESGGALRCLDTQNGKAAWSYPQKGRHFLKLAYNEEAKVFVGICWPYERGGSHQLLRFEPRSGEVSLVSDLGLSGEFAFCMRGSRLLASDGSVIDAVTGRRELALPFPVSSKRGA